MRGFVIAAMVWGVAGSASAAPSYDALIAPYHAALARRCPARHLEWLSPAELRDALDDLKAAQPHSRRTRLDRAEAKGCARSAAGAACPNAQDIALLNRWGLAPRLARLACGLPKQCKAPSDCR